MSGIYMHIPFCESRCIYCGFYSTLTPKRGNEKANKSIIDRYTDAICKELELQKGYLFNNSTPRKENINTIYFGGGTPSQLSIEHIKQVFCQISTTYADHITTMDKMEISFECNPDDITEAFVNHLKSLPINRISMGAQTFDNERLKFLRRRHKAEDIKTAVERLRSVGINNISIDLMFGFPNETIEEWRKDIDRVLELNVEHISAYSLMYEEGTPLYRLLEEGKVADMDEETYRAMYNELIDKLTAARYEQYEISNFARLDHHTKSPYRSRHNNAYWQNKPYLGIGASAHSYNLKTRQWNVSNLTKYIEGIENGTPNFETEEIDARTHYNDLITTALRTCEGINIERLSSHYKMHIMSCAASFIAKRQLALDGNYLRFTREGIYISDSIMSDLMDI